MSPLIPLLADAHLVPKKKRGKGNPDRPHSSNGSKVVFILLTEVVAVHVGLFAVYIWGASLQLLLGHLGDGGSWGGNGSGSSSLQNGLKNLLQVILGVFGDISTSNGGVSKGFCPWKSSRLVGHLVTSLGRWRGVKRSNGKSDRGSDRGTLPAGISVASGWGHLGADFLKHSFKRAG